MNSPGCWAGVRSLSASTGWGAGTALPCWMWITSNSLTTNTATISVMKCCVWCRPGLNRVGSGGTAYRYGGEEFCVVSRASVEEAAAALEAVRRKSPTTACPFAIGTGGPCAPRWRVASRPGWAVPR